MASCRLLLVIGRCCLTICRFFGRIDGFAAHFAYRRNGGRRREFVSTSAGAPPSISFTNSACGRVIRAFGLWPAR
jgi:hypothetical protein